MPFFDYLCDTCGEAFEALVRSGATRNNDQVRCLACGSGKVMRQVVSRVAVRTSRTRRGGVVDLSSGACPCGGHRHAHNSKRAW